MTIAVGMRRHERAHREEACRRIDLLCTASVRTRVRPIVVFQSSWLHCRPRCRSDGNYNPADSWTLGVAGSRLNPVGSWLKFDPIAAASVRTSRTLCLLGRITVLARASTVVFPPRTARHYRQGPDFGQNPIVAARAEGAGVLRHADGEV